MFGSGTGAMASGMIGAAVKWVLVKSTGVVLRSMWLHGDVYYDVLMFDKEEKRHDTVVTFHGRDLKRAVDR